jgi:hypothetical protein
MKKNRKCRAEKNLIQQFYHFEPMDTKMKKSPCKPKETVSSVYSASKSGKLTYQKSFQQADSNSASWQLVTCVTISISDENMRDARAQPGRGVCIFTIVIFLSHF